MRLYAVHTGRATRFAPTEYEQPHKKIGIMCFGTDIAKNPYGVLGTKNYFNLGGISL